LGIHAQTQSAGAGCAWGIGRRSSCLRLGEYAGMEMVPSHLDPGPTWGSDGVHAGRSRQGPGAAGAWETTED
jgi:hypothetical protein